mmetsp:Transcript_22150/g.37506  ORF Transcript_22150/g.37506 Transcript_22150/m.37506 type:complete len:398 (+) Transcript_22150:578-1771(+)
MADLLLRFGSENGNGGDVDGMVNARGTASGDPPLLLAVNGGHVVAVQWLLARGADVHLTDRFGKSALAVARKKARTPYPFDSFKIILRLLESHLDFGGDVQRAEALRLEGNALFSEQQPKRAAVKYSESLTLAADARTWANRSQCYLSIARQSREAEVDFRCRARGRDFYLDLYQRALADAEAAIAMEPREPKAYFRAALALVGLGRVHRALDKLCSGVQSCGTAGPISSNIQKMESMMTDVLQKLQLDIVDRRRLYDEPADQHLRNVFTGSSDTSPVQSGDETFSPSEIPGNMCMWCETLLPPSMLMAGDVQDFKDHEVAEPLRPPSVTGTEERLRHVKNEKLSDARLCMMCSCPVDDKVSPQVLRDKYLGGSIYDVTVAAENTTGDVNREGDEFS